MSVSDNKVNNEPVAIENNAEENKNQENIAAVEQTETPNSGDAAAHTQDSTTGTNAENTDEVMDSTEDQDDTEDNYEVITENRSESGDASAEASNESQTEKEESEEEEGKRESGDIELEQSFPDSVSTIPLSNRTHESVTPKGASIKFKELLEGKSHESSNYMLSDEYSEGDEEDAAGKREMQLAKKKEVTYGTEEEDDEEYVWVEEEVDEEIEVETDEASIEEVGEEERIEEEGEEIYVEETEKEFGEEVGDEEIDDQAELYREEIHEELEGPEEEVGEEVEEIEEHYMLEPEVEDVEKEEREEEGFEVLEDIEQEEKDDKGWSQEGEEQEEEEEGVEEEEFEEGEKEVGEEESKMQRKKHRKVKTIKVLRMVRRKKKDVFEELQKRARPDQSDEEAFELQQQTVEEKLKTEAEDARKEREKTLELMKTLFNELIQLKKKNKNLSKSIIEFYKLRKSENVQETEMAPVETLRRYQRRLKLFKEFKTATNAEKQRLEAELRSMKDELDILHKEYNDEKTEFTNWIAEVGKGVIAQTGKPLEESMVTHIVQRLEMIMNQLSEERLTLLTLQSQIAAKEAAIKDLVPLEGNLSLIDYEQLRMDNQVFSEKIEERDNELSHLRKKILEIIHTQAHVLEKSDALEDSIDTYKSQDHQMGIEVNELREKVNILRKNKDRVREETHRLRKNAGLLIRPNLAIDYQESVGKIATAKSKMDSLIKKYKKQERTIARLNEEISAANSFNSLF